MKASLEAAEMIPVFADITMKASMEVTLDRDGAEKVLRLVDVLEDLDDVQHVYTNADIPTDVLEQLGE